VNGPAATGRRVRREAAPGFRPGARTGSRGRRPGRRSVLGPGGATGDVLRWIDGRLAAVLG